jgi:hypothetical protein
VPQAFPAAGNAGSAAEDAVTAGGIAAACELPFPYPIPIPDQAVLLPVSPSGTNGPSTLRLDYVIDLSNLANLPPNRVILKAILGVSIMPSIGATLSGSYLEPGGSLQFLNDVAAAAGTSLSGFVEATWAGGGDRTITVGAEAHVGDSANGS